AKHGDCHDMLLRGRVDVVALSSNNVEMQVATFAKQGVSLIAVMPVTEVKMYLAFSSDVDDERVARWQTELEKSYLDGTMRSLYQSVYPELMIEQLETFARE